MLIRKGVRVQVPAAAVEALKVLLLAAGWALLFWGLTRTTEPFWWRMP